MENCPKCNSEDIDPAYDLVIEEDNVHVYGTCKCGHHWTRVYEFQGVE